MAMMERPRPVEVAAAPPVASGYPEPAAPVVAPAVPTATVPPPAAPVEEAAVPMDTASAPAAAPVTAEASAPTTAPMAVEASAPAAAPVAAEASAPTTAPMAVEVPAAAVTVAAEAPAAVVTAQPVAPVQAVVAQTPPRPVSNLSAQERREASMQAELYSILRTTEHLEAAFVKGVIKNDVYEQHCQQLIAQFKTLKNALKDKCPDVRQFIREQGLRCPLAEERLLGTGMAATALYTTTKTDEKAKESLALVQLSENFITVNDALKLSRYDVSFTAVDELLPLIRDLVSSISAISNLPQLEGFERITPWLATLNNMRATDSLDEAQCRQLSLDIEQAYTSFKNWLQAKK